MVHLRIRRTKAFPVSTSDTASVINTNTNVLFVGGLVEQCTTSALQQHFEQWGVVEKIAIIGMDDDVPSPTASSKKQQKRKPYAFVQFDKSSSVQAVISDQLSLSTTSSTSTTDGHNLFRQVKPAKPIDPSKRIRSNKSRQSRWGEYIHMQSICNETNLILQVQSTHVDRLKEYLTSYLLPSLLLSRALDNTNTNTSTSEELLIRSTTELVRSLNVLGSTQATKNMSLVFVSVNDPTLLAKELMRDTTTIHTQVRQRALKKMYVVKPGSIKANLKLDTDCQSLLRNILAESILIPREDNNDDDFKLHVFPPSRQKKILSNLENIDCNHILTQKLNPRDATDIISMVQVYEYKGRQSKDSSTSLALCMTGISKSFTLENINNDSNNNSIDEDVISRAYFKLKEAFETYEIDHSASFDRQTLLKDTVAIDVGSAPGGWTKFLAYDMQCKLVHSVDPGELLVDMKNVNHLQMKIQDAMPLLRSKMRKDDDKITVFVSDACLHSMEGQIDFLLDARREGILATNVFFVLTLKCTKGFSKLSFDKQAQTVVEVLKDKTQTKGLSIYHLMSNRSGERTIMGWLQ